MLLLRGLEFVTVGSLKPMELQDQGQKRRLASEMRFGKALFTPLRIDHQPGSFQGS